MQALELGCGRGRISAWFAYRTEANITGLNFCPVQLAEAREFAQRKNLTHVLEFEQCDFNNIPLPMQMKLSMPSTALAAFAATLILKREGKQC